MSGSKFSVGEQVMYNHKLHTVRDLIKSKNEFTGAYILDSSDGWIVSGIKEEALRKYEVRTRT